MSWGDPRCRRCELGSADMSTAMIDPDFLALPLQPVAEAALARAHDLGAEHADVRIERITRQLLRLRDGTVATAQDSTTVGLAVRVIVEGTWGFASHLELTPESAAATAGRAVEVARTLRALNAERVELAAEPVHAGAVWSGDHEIDPFTVPLGEKVALLSEWSRRLLATDGVEHTDVVFRSEKETKFYADSAGTSTTQQRVRMHPAVTAIAVDRAAGSFETMRTCAPPTARGWEYLAGNTVWDWDGELAQLPEWLAGKVKAPSVTPGRYDLVIDPTNLWLTIHESVGHDTEYDRAIGYEAAYAGSSFATPDKLGTLRYGSGAMHVTGDRTEKHGLATIGYDDDGVATSQWDLVRDGTLV